jgi:2-methylisocitrate lyase-like PEP mutase family enzyme
MEAIVAVVRAVAPKPVNVLVGMAAVKASLAELSAAGVRRLSLGGALYRVSMDALVKTAQALRDGNVTAAASAMSGSEIAALLP